MINSNILKGGNMKIPDKVKFLLIFCSGLIFFMTGCVDTSVQTIPDQIVLHSQAKIVNLVPETGGGTITVNFNGTNYTIDPGQEAPGGGQAFIDFISGSKNITVTNANTTFTDLIPAQTEYKMRLFVVWDTTQVNHLQIDTTIIPPDSLQIDTTVVLDSVITSYDVLTANQRYVWQKKGISEGSSLFPVDTIQVAVFNGSPDLSISSVRLYGGDIDESVTAAVDYKGNSGYLKFGAPNGSYSLDIVTGGPTITIGPFNAVSPGRYTAVIYDYSAVVKSNILTDD
jgi:hypothetical protein